MSVAIALGVLGFFFVMLIMARWDDRRENQRLDILIQNLDGAKPKSADADWKQAYALSKSPVPEAQWRAWMEERGYGPEAILERAAYSKRKR